MKKRLVGLDLLRGILAVVVFMFHTRIFVGCEYRYESLICLASAGSVFMTGFFMLSGFSIGYVMQDRELNSIGALKTFYIKRLVGIMPLFLLVMTVYHVVWGDFSVKELLLLLPMDIFGLRSTMYYLPNLQFIWFISNILFCYLLYPFVHNIVRQIRTKTKKVLLAFLMTMLLYVQVVEIVFSTESLIYYSIFYRVVEFSVGVLAASLRGTTGRLFRKPLFAWLLGGAEFFLLYIGIYHMVLHEQSKWCTVFVTPLFLIMLWTLAECGCKWLEKSKVFGWVVSCTFAFYLGQVWTLRFFEKSIPHIMGEYRNLIKLVIVWSSTILLAILLHELVEKPCKKLLTKLFLQNKNLKTEQNK